MGAGLSEKTDQAAPGITWLQREQQHQQQELRQVQLRQLRGRRQEQRRQQQEQVRAQQQEREQVLPQVRGREPVRALPSCRKRPGLQQRSGRR